MLIIFDLDDTLIDTSGSITPFQMKRVLADIFVTKRFEGTFQEIFNDLLNLDKKCASARDTLKIFFRKYNIDQSHYLASIDKIYGDIPEECKIFTVPQALETIELLSKTHTLAIVTAGDPKIQLYKLEKAGMDRSFFCKIDVSSTLDKKKYFESLIKDFSLKSEDVLVCGDKINIDLIPAKELGCKTVLMQWGRGKNQLIDKSVDFKIASLPELYKILEEL